MVPLQSNIIAGYNQGGLIKDKKPFLLVDQAFTRLQNAYIYRDRVKKRDGLELIGRLRRVLANQAQAAADGTATYTIADLLAAFRATEPDAELEPGSVVIKVDPGGANQTFFTDNGVGGWTRTSGTAYDIAPGGPNTINYLTGAITLTWLGGSTPPNLTVIQASFNYFPALPVMGIWERELGFINNEQTVWWDTRYDYVNPGTGFQQFTSVVWAAGDADFFSTANFRGTNPYDRLFFATDFLCTAANPIRYYESGVGTWTNFAPLVSATDTLFQARIIIPYYGRLVMLNVWEGTTAGSYAGANNYFNRCRFSQVGNPLQADAFRSDIFGKGGFIDAPTNEVIVSAAYIKNTLIVQFERSTWQLRYVGEYGLPFIWERISSDFGSDSTFSSVIFDNGVLTVGDRAITTGNALTVTRIDEQIPDEVFQFSNTQDGPKRVIGIRDFQKELVYWCYSDGQLQRKFPNYSLLYNYKNNTFANLRNNVTFYGVYQDPVGVTWDSLTVSWDDDDVLWDDDPDLVPLFPSIVSGNQQGFIHRYGYVTEDEPSLAITAVTIPVDTSTAVSLEIVNHNLETGETIKLTDLLFVDASGAPVATTLNDRLFNVVRVDANNIQITEWDTDSQTYITNYSRTPTSTATYIGGGQVTLFPKMYVETKDFNPYMADGNQLKISYIDFLTDVPVDDPSVTVAMSVNLYVNTSLAFQSNVIVGNRSVPTTTKEPYYVPSSDYVWHRFFATGTGQFIRVAMTYNDDLMNDPVTHQNEWTLNAMNLYTRRGGKTVL